MISYSRLSFNLLLVLVVCAGFVQAADCNETITSKLTLYNPRPYNDIDSSFTLRAYYTNSLSVPLVGNNTMVTLTMQNVTYNMSNNTEYWYITITSNVSEEILLEINASNDNYSCQYNSFTTRFRTPYFVKFQLFKEQFNSTDPTQYENDFQYVVLVDKNDRDTLDMSAIAFNNGAMGIFDSLTSWSGVTSASALPPDDNTYFWGEYTNGEATIKLYEPSNYSVYVMSNKVRYPSNTFWEFQRPLSGEPGYLGNVYDSLAVYNQSNISMTPYGYNNTIFKISLSRFEANSYFAFMNLFYVVLIIILYLAGLAVVVIIAGQLQSGGAQLVLSYLFGAGAIALGFIYAL